MSNDIIDYWFDVNDDDGTMNVYVNDVDDVLINNMSDTELCEWFDLKSDYLIDTNTKELIHEYYANA